MIWNSYIDAALTPWMLAFWGACIGSFINVVVYRFPKTMTRKWWACVSESLDDSKSWSDFSGQNTSRPSSFAQSASSINKVSSTLSTLNIAVPRSACPKCGHKISLYENIPIFSWFWLRGKCSSCKAPIAFRYPAVEMVTSLTFVVIGWRFNGLPITFLWCTFASVLICLSLIDWDQTLLPDEMTIPLLWLGLTASYLGLTIPLPDAIAGVILGYMILWTTFWIFKAVTGKDGMGFGDFKLLAAIGAWMGASFVVPVILIASISGAVIGLAMKYKSSLREGKFIPFGPFIASASMFLLLVQPIFKMRPLF